MKKVITLIAPVITLIAPVIILIATVICLSSAKSPETRNATPPRSELTAHAAVSRPAFFTFPTDVNWSIGYFSNLNMVTLTWPAFSLPGLGPVSFTFQGSTQYINPTTTTSIYWTGYTLTANTSYTLSIGGYNYYFYWPGGNTSQCVITGHS